MVGTRLGTAPCVGYRVWERPTVLFSLLGQLGQANQRNTGLLASVSMIRASKPS